MRRATVVGHFTAYFVDAGTKKHAIRPKSRTRMAWQGTEGKTIFAKRVNHPGVRARPFRERAAKEGLRRVPLAQELVELWNRAA